MGVSENGGGPNKSTLKSRILSIRTPNKVPLVFGNPPYRLYSTTRAFHAWNPEECIHGGGSGELGLQHTRAEKAFRFG